ncbi:hypothetical protein [Neorhodopirellula pilleata]|uniref:Uncharacterized protein n=1 Tax=Neorhodopirellula pilleata TaxID=2714738 RepID=A0A5C6AVT2_9BACT|nr:hypothetical protein [Neorhodopirellula pilleata]TWU03259.1 hypothetical protein Pla100_01770 [Neorhodopirellula pilleata]
MSSPRFQIGLMFLFLCLIAIGCGVSSSAPQTSDLEQYLQGNPDAPKSNGQEPTGIGGPASLPGAEGE